jgi:AAHS family 4-hydroxybenzoate transporter-like MFS transporter
MAVRQNTDLSAIIEKQKLSLFIVRVVFLSWLVTFFDGFDMSVMSFVAPDLSAALHINRLALGKVFSAGQTGMVLGGFLFGYLGDWIGRRLSIILATASFGVLTLELAASGNYAALLGLRFVQGIAVGGLLPLAWALNIEYVPRRFRSTVVTCIMLGWTFGSSFAGPMTIWLVPRYGWRSLFVFGGCAAFVVTGLLLLFLPESIKFLASKTKRPDLIARYAQRLAPALPISAADRFVVSGEVIGPSERFRLSLLFRGELRWMTPMIWAAYTVSSVAVFFNSSWGPTILQAVGFSRSTAALAVSITSLGGAMGGLLLTRFVDKRGAITIMAFPLLAVPALLLMGLSGIGGIGFLALNFFAMMFLVGAHLGLQSIAGIFYPSAYRANGAGWAASIGKIGSIVGPFIGGLLLSSRLHVKHVYALLAICPILVAAGVFIIGGLQRRIASGIGRGLRRNNDAQVQAEPMAPLTTRSTARD